MEKKPGTGEEDEEIKEEIISGDEDEMGEAAEKDFAIESKGTGNYDDDYFDTVIGHIQDIVFDDKFKEVQNHFFAGHCKEFENSEENKIIYTEIFTAYKQSIEQYIEKVYSWNTEQA